MGFRFRRSIKLMPGVRLNLSKSGVSASIGRRGATINVSERGTKATVGIPGTGISYTDNLSLSTGGDRAANDQDSARDGKNLLLGIVFMIALILAAWFISKL